MKGIFPNVDLRDCAPVVDVHEPPSQDSPFFFDVSLTVYDLSTDEQVVVLDPLVNPVPLSPD